MERGKEDGVWCVVRRTQCEWTHSCLYAEGQGQCHLHFRYPTCPGLEWCSGLSLIICIKLCVDFLLEQVWGVKAGSWWDTIYFPLQIPTMAGLSGLPWPEISDPHSWGFLRTGRSQQGLGDHLLREDILTGSRPAGKDQVINASQTSTYQWASCYRLYYRWGNRPRGWRQMIWAPSPPRGMLWQSSGPSLTFPFLPFFLGRYVASVVLGTTNH